MTLLSSIRPDELPKVADQRAAEIGQLTWRERIEAQEDPGLAGPMDSLVNDPTGKALLDGIFSNSPFLTQCLLSETATLADFLERGAEQVLSDVVSRLKQETRAGVERSRVMTSLRVARRQIAMIVALADISGQWSLNQVVGALSEATEALISAALDHLLGQAADRGELELVSAKAPQEDCGYVIFAMGKLGAGELNYSSDVDLIVIFDPEKAQYRHKRGPQEGFVRLTRDLVRLLDERTADGFVCRTDLRLRPDPGAMPLAITYNSALLYYESLGQNWERAAMIKARPIAGDIKLGQDFLMELRPFIWRKNLDFWAIQDIHSIKRQIYAHKGGAAISLPGHNIKLGRGGIREIEFYAQTQQLIWGGREPALRQIKTIAALEALAKAGHITHEVVGDLSEAYFYLRRLEHRLQMVNDQQTHDLPKDEHGLSAIAAFMGYSDLNSFVAEVNGHLLKVEQHYAKLFEESEDLSGPGNLVFTGTEVEPTTAQTLTEMGFADPQRVFSLVSGWHHGRYRATRSTRSRQLLTEMMPALLQELSETAQPDQGLMRLDEFLARLPAGVQIFSMIAANPSLLNLLAEIMGEAPALAQRLSHRADLLESVLAPEFFDRLPDSPELCRELKDRLVVARDYEDILDHCRRWAKDRQFQVGVHILRHSADVDDSSRALSDIADTVLQSLYPAVLTEFVKRHGQIGGPGLAVLALGKLGAREMTVSSDLDLVFLFDTSEGTDHSDGEKPLDTSSYHGRLAQRFINALTAKTSEGELYETDMRLRPSGNAGPIATPLSGFQTYYRDSAWTWEHMALTRARLVTGEPAIAAKIEETIQAILTQPRDADQLLADVASMRARIEKEHPANSIWSVKYLRGGLIDLEFLAQYHQLLHAAAHPQILDAATTQVFANLAQSGQMEVERAQGLIEATKLIRQIQGMLRLTVGPAFNADTLPESLQQALAREAQMADFPTLRRKLIDTAAWVHQVFQEIIEDPAAGLPASQSTQTPP
ncbi:MAG: bifunctional [glutamine synthetase] adenylyltransferase/[glutamine synthetase]-adenylyl-L-tyrosine phosphorylase [Pseudomonadota bacterium]